MIAYENTRAKVSMDCSRIRIRTRCVVVIVLINGVLFRIFIAEDMVEAFDLHRKLDALDDNPEDLSILDSRSAKDDEFEVDLVSIDKEDNDKERASNEEEIWESIYDTQLAIVEIKEMSQKFSCLSDNLGSHHKKYVFVFSEQAKGIDVTREVEMCCGVGVINVNATDFETSDPLIFWPKVDKPRCGLSTFDEACRKVVKDKPN